MSEHTVHQNPKGLDRKAEDMHNVVQKLCHQARKTKFRMERPPGECARGAENIMGYRACGPTQGREAALQFFKCSYIYDFN